jgi:arylsulfatase A-like enzyme
MKIKRRVFLGGMLAAGAGTIGAGVARFTTNLMKKRSNLVLITADTVRAESMSCYGHPLLTTPCADELAAQGVLFSNAYATSVCTLPGHSSIFTGLFPDRHGVISNNRSLPREFPTLAEILGREGYETAAFIGVGLLNEPKGVARGFRLLDWEESDHPSPLNIIRRSGEYIEQIIQFLRRMKSGKTPFFLWIHSFDAHAPYMPPGAFGSMFVKPGTESFDMLTKMQGTLENLKGYRPEFPREFMESQYLGELRYWDTNFQKIFSVLHESENLADTLVVYTADHGENVGEGDMYGHLNLNQQVIRIPLIMWHPDRLPVGTVQTPVQQTDLVPTLLKFLGIHCDQAHIDGSDLMPLILGRHPENLHRPVFVINAGYDSAAIIDEGSQLKVIKQPVVTPPDPMSDPTGHPVEIETFSDTITENDHQWRIRKTGSILTLSYSGQIMMDKSISSVMMLLTRRNPAGNLVVDMLRMVPSESSFSFVDGFPRYRSPNPVSEAIPCDFTAMISTPYVRYSLWFFESDERVAYVSPWIHCQVTDEHGTAVSAQKGSLNRIIHLKMNEGMEWGITYDDIHDPDNLMARLDQFLNRKTDMPYRIKEPEITSSSSFILPGTGEFERASPEQIYGYFREMTVSAEDSERFEKTRRELESLGYTS